MNLKQTFYTQNAFVLKYTRAFIRIVSDIQESHAPVHLTDR